MNTGRSGASVSKSSPCGTFSSRTMIVITIARTPSLNASSLFLPMLASDPGLQEPPTYQHRHRSRHDKQEKQDREFLGNGVASFGDADPHIGPGSREP